MNSKMKRIIISPFVFIAVIGTEMVMCIFPLPLFEVLVIVGLLSLPFIKAFEWAGYDMGDTLVNELIEDTDIGIENRFLCLLALVVAPIWLPFLITASFIKDGEMVSFLRD